MAGTSKHIGDIAIWIQKVIKSCETPVQEIAARRMIRSFEDRLLLEKSEFYDFYSRTLRSSLDINLLKRRETLPNNVNQKTNS